MLPRTAGRGPTNRRGPAGGQRAASGRLVRRCLAPRGAARIAGRHAYARGVVSLPAAARLACWLNAWVSSRESADAVISGVDGRLDRAHFVGSAVDGTMSTALFLGALRRLGVRRVSSALPAPGDPLGLGGPAAFNADVVDAGQGVLLHGPDLGLVPVAASDHLGWRVVPASPPPYLPAVAEADRDLRTSMIATADRLADLDVASWQPEVADLLTTLRQPPGSEAVAPYASAQSARLASDAMRAARIVSLARADDGGALSAFEAAERAEALRPLDRAARTALVAATSTLDGR